MTPDMKLKHMLADTNQGLDSVSAVPKTTFVDDMNVVKTKFGKTGFDELAGISPDFRLPNRPHSHQAPQHRYSICKFQCEFP